MGYSRGTLGVLFCGLAFLVSGCLAPTAPYSVRDDWGPTVLVTGYLTWSGTQGGISWNPAATSQDPGGRADPTTGLKSALGWNLRSNAGNDQGLIVVDEFLSEPLNQTLYLNASRLIQLDLFVKNEHCTVQPDSNAPDPVAADVELYAGDRFLGGQLHGFYPPWTLDTSVDGHCVRYYRLHAELDTLPSGTALKLLVIHTGELTSLQYGLGSNHRSVLRLPTYSAEDAHSRVPELAAAAESNKTVNAGVDEPREGEDPKASKGPAAPIGVAGAAGLGLLGVAGLNRAGARRRLAAGALALFFVTLAFSGCFGFDPALGQELEGFGRIEGVIRDEFGFSLASVHLSVLTTSNFTDTDSKGHFAISSVPAGERVVRLEKADFKIAEETVLVLPGETAWLNLTLGLVIDRGPDSRPHDHDIWGKLPSLPLFTGDVAFQQYDLTFGFGPRPGSGGICLNAEVTTQSHCMQFFQFPPVEEPPDPVIYPGTYDIEAKITWSPSDNQVERVGLGFFPNLQGEWNYTYMYPRRSGEPFHIRTNWEMGDAGHQRYTDWIFFLYIPTNAGSPLPVATLTQLVKAPFHVEMTIHKGVVPVEAGHKDFWEKNQTISVMKDWQLYGACTACELPRHYYGWYPWTLVPPGTTWLEVELTHPETGATHVPVHDWGIVYKPAHIPPNPPLSEYREANPYQGDSTHKFYRIPLKNTETDGYYAKSSNWEFLLDDRQDGQHLYDVNGGQFKLTVTAHRDAMPKT